MALRRGSSESVLSGGMGDGGGGKGWGEGEGGDGGDCDWGGGGIGGAVCGTDLRGVDESGPVFGAGLDVRADAAFVGVSGGDDAWGGAGGAAVFCHATTLFNLNSLSYCL